MSKLPTSNYDKQPTILIPDSARACAVGWPSVLSRLGSAIAECGVSKCEVVIECYPGVDTVEITRAVMRHLAHARIFSAGEAMLPPASIQQLVTPFLGSDDPVFGFLSGLQLPDFFDPDRVSAMQSEIASSDSDLIVVIGCGASLISAGDVLIYADLARWEAQLRFRRNVASNLGADNRDEPAPLQYKRAYFVDWRVADRWKRPLISQWDFLLDTHMPDEPKLVEGDAIRRGLSHSTTRPFRVVPFFDPAPWGGQWMKEVCDLDRTPSNYGWCFDCVPEENSLLMQFGETKVELPSLNLVFHHPREILGEAVHARFGDEFPIRFDFLDTMGGGNLSFQVHPLTEYIQHHFGMHYTQDESYYLLDAAAGAAVYLGLREGVDREAMVQDLENARRGGFEFPAEQYANQWPARQHDHFLIPAGTVHCSGANAMVLEISATPYIFTFKMWDWGRLGLDGKPRPIHLKHGVANIQWDRTTDWVKRHLINQFEELDDGPGWREERTGLHSSEFIETRRHWFTGTVPHHTGGGVNVLNLVQGRDAIVESPDEAFEPFTVHYAETFIVPAAIGAYTIRPGEGSTEQQCATVKAFVRT